MTALIPLTGCVLPEETAKSHCPDGYREQAHLFLTCGSWNAQLLTSHDVMSFFRLTHGEPICDVHAVTQDQSHPSLLPLTPVSGIYCTSSILEPQVRSQCP